MQASRSPSISIGSRQCQQYSQPSLPGLLCTFVARTDRSASVISLTDSESEWDDVRSKGRQRSPSAAAVISLTDSEPDDLDARSNRRQRSPSAASVISLTDLEPDDSDARAALPSPVTVQVVGSTPAHPHPLHITMASGERRRSPSVISLTDSDSDANCAPSLPPQPIIKWRSNACVRSRGESLNDPISVEDVQIWPNDFHVCDIAQFIRLTRLPGRQSVLHTMFEEYFGMPYSPRAFRRTRMTWECRENKRLQDRFIEYGRSEKATWARFLTEANRTF